MPIELVYLAALLITICIFFIVLKRPIYEGMLAGFIVMLAMTNQWSHAWELLITFSISKYPISFLSHGYHLPQGYAGQHCVSLEMNPQRIPV